MTAKLAFLCLGTMGAPMAAHLRAAGADLCVWNRSAGKAERFVAEHGGRRAATPAEAAEGAELVFACTGADADLRAIATGPDGAFHALGRGAVFVDHTTASAEVARELAALAADRGAGFLDAPVSGGYDGAQRGRLTVMAGGAERDFAKAEPWIRRYAGQLVHMGPAGAGQLTKMVNQVCIAGLLQGLSEGLAFAERAGLDPHRVVEAISRGAAGSWQMDHRARTMIEGRFDFGFAVDWMRKDLAIARSEAARVGAALPVAGQVDGYYAEIQRRGGGRLDTSSLITLLRGPGSGGEG